MQKTMIAAALMNDTSRRSVRRMLKQRQAKLVKGVWLAPRAVQKITETIDDNKRAATARLIGMAQYLWELALGSVAAGEGAVHLQNGEGERFSIFFAVTDLRQVMVDIEPWFADFENQVGIEVKEPQKETIADYLYGLDGNRCVFVADAMVKEKRKVTLAAYKRELEAALADLQGETGGIISAAILKEDSDDCGWHDSHEEKLRWEIEAGLGVLEEVIAEYGRTALVTDEFKWE